MAPDTSAPPETPIQLGNYDVLAKIADGGMGTVYKAKHRYTGNVVAIKVIAPGPARNPIMLQRFEREFQAARVLEHPNVVRALEYYGSGPHPFFVMEYVDGESLGQWMERAGALPEADAVRFIGQVCDGLQRAHKQGLVHRDVKPDNILVTRDGVAKLTDLGLVKEVENDLNLTRTGRGLGTPHYMAPEQFRNAKRVDVRGDIYSLGATLYALVTGVVPFGNASPLDCWLKKVRNEFPPPRELNPKVSDRVDWAVRRAMSAEPSQRPASCREFYEDLTGQSRPSSGVTYVPAANGAPPADLWYLVYKDETGQTHTVKGTTDAIRDALRDGLLGDGSSLLVGRSKVGQFQPLKSLPEFRDLIIGPVPLSGTVRAAVGRSGLVTTPAPRGDVPAASGVIDLATQPVDSGRFGPPSGRLAAAAPPVPASLPLPSGLTPTGTVRSQRPTPPRVTSPTPQPVPDPACETATTTPTPSPLRVPLPDRRPDLAGAGRGRKPSDWTPVVAVVLMVLSAVAGFLMFNR